MLHVVAALIRKDGDVLLAKRSKGELKGYWEFPGGKVRLGEEPELAIVREIKEELNINILPIKPVRRFHYKYPFAHINLQLIECEIEPKSQKISMAGSHSEYKWVDMFRTELELAPLDKKIINHLRKMNG